MEKMTMDVLALKKDGTIFRGPVTVGFVGICQDTFNDMPCAVVMMDPENEFCRERYGIDESNPYVVLPLKDLRPTSEEFNRIFDK